MSISSTSQLTIKDIVCTNLPKTGKLPKRAGCHYLIISVQDKVQRTPEAPKGSNPSWNNAFHFDVDESDRLKICVHAKHTIGRDALVDTVEVEIGSLVSPGKTEVIKRALTHEKSFLTFTLALSAKPISSTEGTALPDKSDNVVVAKDLSRTINLPSGPSQALHAVVGVDTLNSAQFSTLSSALMPVIEKLEAFTMIADRIGEIHPYAKVACALFTIPCKIFLAQQRRDLNIQKLVETVDGAYSFVLEAEPLQRIETHKKIVEVLLKQTIECGYFIKEYAEDDKFVSRALKHMSGGIDKKIAEFIVSIAELHTSFLGHAAITTEITILRILDKIEEQGSIALLNDLPYARGAGCQPDKMCLPGTRTSVIDEIVDWVHLPNSDQVPRMFLLTGVAGAGKSAIAHTVAVRFRQMKRLGSSFCFDASKQSERRPELLFSTMSRDFSDLDGEWRRSLAKVVASSAALRTTSSILEQFEQFLLGPAQNLSILGPIVFVIDALDECAKGPARRAMLQLLAERSAELPPNFKILMTSRPEDDIMAALVNNPNVRCKTMESIGDESTNADIANYVEKRLAKVEVWDDRWPNREWIRLLVERSENLFQWAFTACEYITGDETAAGSDPSEQVASLLSTSKQDGLDGLYTTILERAFKFKDCHEIDPRVLRFKAVMGRILTVREPLSMTSLVALRRDGERENEAELIVRHLGSVLRGVSAKDVPIQPLHTSFRDFLTDQSRSGLYFIDLRSCSDDLVAACLPVMRSGLKFNICHLETSYLKNSDLNDLASRVERYIPPYLSYSCRFWVHHLLHASFTPELEDSINTFLQSWLLFWLEVLSLLKEVRTALQALQDVRSWAQSHNSPVADLAGGALQFVKTFRVAIVHSTPHLYVSALPFAFDHSVLSRCRIEFPRTLVVAETNVEGPPLIELELRGSSVAFSCDDDRIISVSEGTIKIYSMHTGELVGPPLDSAPPIISANFSPDGKHIVSVTISGLIRIWDAHTGELIGNPTNEPAQNYAKGIHFASFSPYGKRVVLAAVHSIVILDLYTGALSVELSQFPDADVRTVAFSPDDRFILGGFAGGLGMKMWNAQTGSIVPLSFEGFDNESTVANCVAFSPDGELIAVGTVCKTVRVLSSRTGKLTLPPFHGHTEPVRSVSFSSDGGRIVSGSEDKTIRIWNVHTGEVIAGPFKGQRGGIRGVAFSFDGNHFGSASEDGTVMIWNSAPGGRSSDLVGRHIARIGCALFSSDSERIYSGSDDCTVKAWDVVNGKVTATTFVGHTNIVTAIALSPDGKHILSASRDRTIVVWDAQTGSTITGPFKLEGHAIDFSAVAFSADGALVVSGSVDGSVQVWDSMTGAVIAGPVNLIENRDGIRSVAFSPDGGRVVTGGYAGINEAAVTIWDVHAVKHTVVSLEGHTEGIVSVAFSPDGQRVAAATQNAIKLWSAQTYEIVGEFDHSEADPRYTCIAFSPDGEFVVSGSFGRGIFVWDSRAGKAIMGPLHGHTDVVNAVVFSPCGKRFVSSSDDQAMRVWNFEASRLAKVEQPVEVITQADTTLVEQDISSQTSPALPSDPSPDFGNVAAPLMDNYQIEDGWVLGPHRELMFWLPWAHRRGLWRPSNKNIISKNTSKLDFSNFVHGTSWAQCYSGQPT